MLRGRSRIVFGNRVVHSKSHQGVQAPSLLCSAAEAVGLAGERHIPRVTNRSRHQVMQILWVNSGIGGKIAVQDSLKGPFA